MRNQRKTPKNRFTKQKTAVPLIIIGAAVLMVIAIVAYLAFFDNRPITDQDTIARVSPAEAKQAFDQQSAVFLDVRVADAFAESHIPGAISIPVAELESKLGTLNKQDWIITYCT